MSSILNYLARFVVHLSKSLDDYLDYEGVEFPAVLPRNRIRPFYPENMISPLMLPPPLILLEESMEHLQLSQRIFRIPDEFPETEDTEGSGNAVDRLLILGGRY